MRPFKIIKRIGRLAYKLELLSNIKIYNVISVVYLELITDFAENFYRRYRFLTPIVVIEDEEKYKIEKLLRKRNIK